MSIGQQLRDARMARGLTLEEVSDKTKIRSTLLVLIEENNFHKVGAPTYVRGHITAYANCVGIDASELLKGFEDSSGDTPLDKSATPLERKLEVALDRNLEVKNLKNRSHEISTESKFNWTTLMVAALGLVMVVGIASFVTRVNQESTVPPLAEIESVIEETPEVVTETTGPVFEEDNLTANSNPDLVLIVLEAVDGNSWVNATDLNGETLYEGTIREGESQTISNLEDVQLLLGNAGALNVTLNGQPFGKAGGNGEVKRCTATFTFLECN